MTINVYKNNDNNMGTVSLINGIVNDYDFVRLVSGLSIFLNSYLILFYVKSLTIKLRVF